MIESEADHDHEEAGHRKNAQAILEPSLEASEEMGKKRVTRDTAKEGGGRMRRVTFPWGRGKGGGHCVATNVILCPVCLKVEIQNGWTPL